MNVFIVTAGQCGSRVVSEAFVNLGYEAVGAHPENLDTTLLGRLEQRFLADRDLIRTSLNFIKQHDNAVFKSLPLMRCVPSLRGQIVMVYRHPGAWKTAHKKRLESRLTKEGLPKKVEKNFVWWNDYHTYMLMYARELQIPLIDFSMDFEEDMTRHFGDCLEHYDPARINEHPSEDGVPIETLKLYEDLTECRKSMVPSILTPSTSAT